MSMRIGIGWDSHAFKAGVPLRIGGLTIDHPEGLAGHSDGDVLLHAITDALLGAVSAGDIGTFFPPHDPRWKDADSVIFLNLALEEIQNAGYRIVNVDTTLVLAAPRIGPLAMEMRERLADMLDVEPGAVGIKAKTPEGMNLDHIAQAHAVVLLEKLESDRELKSLSATVADEDEVEDVLKSLASVASGPPRAKRIVLPPFDTEDMT
ncbi:MAG TPA: 2-C-methyl-D-erythritol 2,4-cyclodiphosphate synthase [Acidisarcina sp.]